MSLYICQGFPSALVPLDFTSNILIDFFCHIRACKMLHISHPPSFGFPSNIYMLFEAPLYKCLSVVLSLPLSRLLVSFLSNCYKLSFRVRKK
jgi:hypothetical protein